MTHINYYKSVCSCSRRRNIQPNETSMNIFSECIWCISVYTYLSQCSQVALSLMLMCCVCCSLSFCHSLFLPPSLPLFIPFFLSIIRDTTGSRMVKAWKRYKERVHFELDLIQVNSPVLSRTSVKPEVAMHAWSLFLVAMTTNLFAYCCVLF